MFSEAVGYWTALGIGLLRRARSLGARATIFHRRGIAFTGAAPTIGLAYET
jgi:hypothetical protein